MNEYEVRDAVLREMGYASYQQYLDSDLWWEIRGRAMARTAGRCVRCRATATEVHHSSYAVEVLQGYNILPLLPVCHPCHTLAEFNPSGAKRFDPREINAILTPLPTVKHTPTPKPQKPSKKQKRAHRIRGFMGLLGAGKYDCPSGANHDEWNLAFGHWFMKKTPMFRYELACKFAAEERGKPPGYSHKEWRDLCPAPAQPKRQRIDPENYNAKAIITVLLGLPTPKLINQQNFAMLRAEIGRQQSAGTFPYTIIRRP